MRYLPLFLNLDQRPVLVVGAGEVALRKLETLARAGAAVRIVALQVSTAVAALAATHDYPVEQRAFQAADLDGVWLVIAAAGDERLNAQLSTECEARRIFLNVVDDTPRCSAIFPSIVDRDPLLVAISSAGQSPTLARRLRALIEDLLPDGLGAFGRFLGRQRERVAARFPAVRDRQHFWDDVLSRRPLGELVRELDQERLQDWFDEQLATAGKRSVGQVALVGAGPGDPELITLRGLSLLRRADVVLYDNLVPDALLDRARRDAEKIYVGKKGARAEQSTPQESINELMAAQARAGNDVVRLKGGDPFIFARGGEELAHLVGQGIPTVVVPGISAAMGGASYAGIPLTHRDASQSVRFVTGHRAADRANLDWPELAKADQTLVIYMGLPQLGLLMQRLVEYGRDPETPAALIDRATLPEQQVIVGTVSGLAEQVAAAAVKGPTLIIVGEVVRFRVPG